MQKQYDSLFQMIQQDREASTYFDSLPEYVQSTIKERADNVCSMQQLQIYANNLLQGDD